MIERKNCIEQLDEYAAFLWQGKGIDINSMTNFIMTMVEQIEMQRFVFRENGIDFPYEFVYSAIESIKKAIESRDDYILADCIFFEWREIMLVFYEVIDEVTK